MGGPRWLGIGAQRSGTTWFTDLLMQHPRLRLSSKNRKELHYLHRYQVNIKRYRRLFKGCAGEWTPAYLRNLIVPPVAARALDDDVPVLVMLREPVERFASAMRHYYSRNGSERSLVRENVRLLSDATWGGMFATQLDEWARHIGAERMLVLQYEAVRADPQHYVDLVWRRLGLDPVPLDSVERTSRTASTVAWGFPEGLEDSLTRLYAPEVRQLEGWGFDLDLWPRFALGRAEAASTRTPSLAGRVGRRR